MPKTVFYTATSLNGFIADEANSLSWLFAVEEGGAPDIAAFMSGIGVLVEGSTTYEWVLREEGLLERPHRWQELYGERPTFVFTTRTLPTPAGADVRFVRGKVADALPDLITAAQGKDVWVVGGGDLAGQFLDADALDEIQVSVAPVALTGGAPLLPRRVEADRLHLRSASQHGQFAHLTYDVRRPASR